jgi:serine protease Do
MRRFFILVALVLACTLVVRAQSARFIVDDDAFSDGVVQASERLLLEHKLVPLDSLRKQVHSKGVSIKLPPLSREKLEPVDLCDRLRQSTLAVGTFYKCPDCGGWHFNSSAGFVVGENGIVCTCCHVIMEDDDEVREAYLVAADAGGHVFSVQSVVAADTDADTCLIRIGATGLKPLPLRPGVRAGEPVYCLSHPGGYFFMFTQGMVARVNQRMNADTDEHDRPNDSLSRPVLLLNITAEFAPGSSGAPIVDPYGNVVGQVASIADAGEPSSDRENQSASPSVPIRFCTATEEIMRLTDPNLAKEPHAPVLKPANKKRLKAKG